MKFLRLLTLLIVSSTGSTAFAAPTYNKDVAPILWKHCATCHRTGEVGPFPLLTYKDSGKRAAFLLENIEAKRMPPWKAEAGYGHFKNERRLSDDELKTVREWVKAGAPEGEAKDLPAAPTFTEGWTLGEPDQILKMQEPFKIPGSGKDLQQCFVIPISNDTDKFVSAVEFRPGNRKVVHHAIMYLDANGMGRLRDRLESGPGYASFAGPGIIPTGALGGWAPGAGVQHLPEGLGKFLKKGSDLILQIHYHPSGKEEMDQSSVGIYYSKKPVEKIVGGVAVRSRKLYIPANEKEFKTSAESDPLPVAVDAIGVFPHMHYVGKVMKAWALTPEGSEIPLIWIKDWDFNWQGSYQFAEHVRIPKGSIIKMEAVYDNSTDNPRNPSNPPKPVKWGEQTTDEMCLFGVQIVTDTKEDLRKVMQMPNNRLAMLLSSGVPADSLKDKSSPSKSAPSADYPIPEKYREQFDKYDLNKDGKMSKTEIDAMPAELGDKVRDYISKNPLK
jgi:hypothetical protein